MKPVLGGFVALLITCAALVSAQQSATPPDPMGLRIVVIEGEDAVNIVQQKTAVEPLVEVRDSNDLPVVGATVQFTIQRVGGAGTASFANGETVVTVATDAAGRAASSPLQAIGRGALRIDVQATYQGQVATATVSQTNFATVAEAASAGRTPTPQSGGGAGTGAGGTGAGSGSLAGTIAGIGAAGLSGALAANEARQDSGCASSGDAFTFDLSAAFDSCVGSSSSPQCQSASQRASDSLGEWCSCEGAGNVDAKLRAEGSSLTELSTLAGFPGVGFPASCR